ncbi:MAG: hypothetical protein AAF889_07725 [Cyanobacteria bacterium P01_D01_bin.73]
MLILSPQDVALSRMRHPETQQKMAILTYQSHRFGLVRKFERGDRQDALDFCKDLAENKKKTCVLLEENNRYSVWGKLKRLENKNSAASSKLAIEEVKVENDTLFNGQEAGELQTASEEEFSQILLKKLNQNRKDLGRVALGIVHDHPSAQYRRTSNVFVAYRDGGGLVYGLVIHWFREIALGVGKNLTTKVTWEVVEKRHLRAEVAEDESIFSPGNAGDLDRFFAGLLPRL